MNDSGKRLEVLRNGRKVGAGTLEDLVGLAKAGKLQPRDQIAGVSPAGPVALHSIAELTRLVPTYHEYLVSRSLNALVIFDAFIGPLLALALILVLVKGGDWARVREVLFLVVMFFAIFGLPVVPLARQRTKLIAKRQAGVAAEPELDSTQDDQAFRVYLARNAPVTTILMVSIVVPFVASFLLPDRWLEEHFAKINDRIRAGEVWRLLTAMFLHLGLGHLIFNCSALAEFGRAVENLYGRRRLLLVYFTAGIVGFAASFITMPQPSIGASGGIFGLMGVLITVGFRYRHRLPVNARRRLTVEMAICIGINIALGLLATFIDNAAHIGGLIAGIACGAIMQLQPEAATHLK
jgi:membrane associated rhomboid family serine protease